MYSRTRLCEAAALVDGNIVLPHWLLLRCLFWLLGGKGGREKREKIGGVGLGSYLWRKTLRRSTDGSEDADHMYSRLLTIRLLIESPNLCEGGREILMILPHYA